MLFTAQIDWTINRKTKAIVTNADRRLFGNMVLIAQSRKLKMRDVLTHPLGHLPWALSNEDGGGSIMHSGQEYVYSINREKLEGTEVWRKLGSKCMFVTSSDECIERLEVVMKKSMTFNPNKKRPTRVSCYMLNMMQKSSQCYRWHIIVSSFEFYHVML